MLARADFGVDGKVIAASQEFLAMLGYEEHEVVGGHYRALGDPGWQGSAAYDDCWRQLIRAEFKTVRIMRIAKNGRRILLGAAYVPLVDHTGKPHKIVEFTYEIRREAPQDHVSLVRRTDQIRTAASAMACRAVSARPANAARSRPISQPIADGRLNLERSMEAAGKQRGAREHSHAERTGAEAIKAPSKSGAQIIPWRTPNYLVGPKPTPVIPAESDASPLDRNSVTVLRGWFDVNRAVSKYWPNSPSKPTPALRLPKKRSSAVDTVVDAFRSMILSGDLKVGDDLPPERDIAAQMHVSRNTMREALRRLEAYGVVETRQKRGARIVDRTADAIINVSSFHLPVDHEAASDIQQYRRVVESGLVGDLIRNLRPQDADELLEINKAFGKRAKPEKLAEADLAFHRKLIAIAGNEAALKVFDMLSPLLLRALLQDSETRGTERIRLEHESIVSALKAGNETALRAVIEKHAPRQ